MGVVYHALDPNIGRPVAIKTIRIGDSGKPEEQQRLQERLLREARSAGILSHPGIVTIYDVEKQGDLAYIAMEYVDGPTLDHLLSQGRPMAPQQIFSILGQTAAALDYAHQKGIVHRDIKPANIMIAADGTTKITDFGIAKVTATDQFTMTGTIVGTPHYMSPEQVQGQAVDGRSDQFSLAVIAYEILTGEKPYTGEHLTTVVYKIVAEEPVAAHRLNPTLAGAIENTLKKGLAKKPDGRYRNCQEFTEALERACAATRAWKPMVRGGGLNEPTVVEASSGVRGAPAVVVHTLPPARNPRREETTEAREHKSSFVPWLVAIVLVTGLLAVISQLNGPSLQQKVGGIIAAVSGIFNKGGTPANAPQGTPPSTPQSPVQPAPAAQNPAVAQNAPSVPPAIDEKPSAFGPPDTSAEPSKPPAKTAPPEDESATSKARAEAAPTGPAKRATARPVLRAAAVPQDVTVISSPAGATATLDGQADVACTTPCKLQALPGRHTIAITKPGYLYEHQDVDIGSEPRDVQVVLRAPGGTLSVTSAPAGASISINGKKYSGVTPALIPLSVGTYNITVEMDGKQNTKKVEVQNGALTLLEFKFE
jgi:serine/threonine protein kinase